jgi:hypothetical protein
MPRDPEALVIVFKLLILNGGQRRDRTADAGLFRTNISCIYNNLDGTDGTVSHLKSYEALFIVGTILGYAIEARLYERLCRLLSHGPWISKAHAQGQRSIGLTFDSSRPV